MTCDAVHRRLNALLDGECSADEAEQLTTHLAQCAACAVEYTQLTDLRQAANAWDVEGGDVWSALREQIETPDLTTVVEELRQLRAEVRSLRAEIAMLRTQAADKASPVLRSPSPLLPYTPTTTRELHIA
jgi:anti-sigma factor RsiW